MSRTALLFQTIDSVGEVVGNIMKPFEVGLHGWTFYNSGAATYTVDFYKQPDPTNGKDPTAPAVAGATKIFSIALPAATSKEFYADKAIFFKYGVFAIASNAAVVGGVFWS